MDEGCVAVTSAQAVAHAHTRSGHGGGSARGGREGWEEGRQAEIGCDRSIQSARHRKRALNHCSGVCGVASNKTTPRSVAAIAPRGDTRCGAGAGCGACGDRPIQSAGARFGTGATLAAVRWCVPHVDDEPRMFISWSARASVARKLTLVPAERANEAAG